MGQNGEMLPLPDGEEQPFSDQEHNVNLANVLDSSELSSISGELIKDFEEDKNSRDEWLTAFAKGLDLLGIKSEERDQPFPGASGVTHPLLS